MNVGIFYYSATGVNYQLAKWAEEALKDRNVEVRRRKFEEDAPRQAIESNEAWKEFVDSEKNENEKNISLDDLEWSDVIIFSVPTRYGNYPSQVQKFFDTTGGLWSKGKLVNKIVTAMGSAQNPHGGQESTIQAIYKTMCHWGCIIVPPGYAFEESFAAGGNPYGTTTATDGKGKVKDDVESAVKKQAQRVVEVAHWISKGKN
jgi:NAD(P)H dehydrogenase (quinone)